MSSHTHDIKKEIRGYLLVGGTLLFLTGVTVAVSYLHVEIHIAVIIALIIATIKGSLVCLYFMHLISERQLIYGILIIVIATLVGLPALTLWNEHNLIHGTTKVDVAADIASHKEAPSGAHH